MAKLTDDIRNKILSDWKAGYSQNKLAKQYEVSPATINKLCKGIPQENKDLVNIQSAINTELLSKSEYEVNSINKAVEEQTKHRTMIMGNAEKLGAHIGKLADDENVLMPNDIKMLVDANDKLAITTGIAQRHANSQINIDNTNAIQSSTKIDIDNASPKEITNAYLDMIKS